MRIPFFRNNDKKLDAESYRTVEDIVEGELHEKEDFREKFVNFRWVFLLCPSRSSIVLSPSNLASPSLKTFISRVGCFMELSHSVHNLPLIFTYLDTLTQPHFPLEQYSALRGSSLVTIINGDTAKARAYISHAPNTHELFLAFSGTANLEQTLHDLDSRKVRFCPTAWDVEGLAEDRRKVRRRWLKHSPPCGKVHRGFARVYRGLRRRAFSELLKALNDEALAISEVIVTGHSLGAALSSLFVFDLLHNLNNDANSDLAKSFSGINLKLVVFGSPRVGDKSFARTYEERSR